MLDDQNFNEIREDYQKLVQDHTSTNAFDPTQFYNDTLNWLNNLLAGQRRLLITNTNHSEFFNNHCGDIALKYFHNYPILGIKLLTEFWHKLGGIQKDLGNQQIYKAGIGFYLARLHLTINDFGMATRWALLTHAEDALNRHFTGSGSHLLHSTLAVDDVIRAEINNIALSHIESENDWSHYSRFSEDVILELVLQNPHFSSLLARTTEYAEFSTNPTYLESLFGEVKSANDNHIKGKSLEHLVASLVTLIPGWIPNPNLVKGNKVFETDILVSDLSHNSNVNADLFGRNFIVECKNYRNQRVGSSHVGYFLYRARLTHVNFAILFSMNGITGDGKNHKDQRQDRIAASGLIQMAYHEDDILCIVITEQDIHKIIYENVSFRSLLLQKTTERRFGN